MSLFSFRRLRVILLLLMTPGTALAEPSEADVLDLGAGAAMVAFSSEHSTDWRAQWSAIALLDGTSALGWCSRDGAPFPHWFVVELPGTFELTSFALDNRKAQEKEAPGISARNVEIEVSTTGADSGFRRVAAGEVERGGRTSFPLEAPARARWIKVTVLSNWGHARYTELMELEAEGDSIDEGPAVDLSGVYDDPKGSQTLRTVLIQEGAHLTGCYSVGNKPLGRITGRVEGRTAEVEWRQPHDNGAGLAGSFLLVVGQGGQVLDGLWYGRGGKAGLIGRWPGRRTDAEVTDACEGDDLRAALEQTGAATLYGLHFQSDSARLTSESTPTLEEILRVLGATPELKLSIEGHTDATATEAHNLDLSRRRAAAVVTWLVERGVAPDRLQATGFGEAKPVADNSTPQGRRLNRRVELTVLK